MLESALIAVTFFGSFHVLAYIIYLKRGDWTYRRSYQYGFAKVIYYFASFCIAAAFLITIVGILQLFVASDLETLLLPFGILLGFVSYGFRWVGAKIARREKQGAQ